MSLNVSGETSWVLQGSQVRVEAKVVERYGCDVADRSVYTEVARLSIDYANESKSAIAIRMGTAEVYRTRVARDRVALAKGQLEYETEAHGPKLLPLWKPDRTEMVLRAGAISTGELKGAAIVRRFDSPDLMDLIGVGDHVMQLDFIVEIAPVTGTESIGEYEPVMLRTNPFPFVITKSPRMIQCK